MSNDSHIGRGVKKEGDTDREVDFLTDIVYEKSFHHTEMAAKFDDGTILVSAISINFYLFLSLSAISIII